MAFYEGIGTILAVSATAPASHTASGHAALTHTAVGEAGDIPEYGPESSVTTFTPLATGIVNKVHGDTNYGSMSLPVAWDPSDAGQDILRAAMTSKSEIHFEITYPTGDIDYFTAKVFSLRRGASTGTGWMGSINIEITSTIIPVDA